MVEKGYGMASLEYQLPITARSRFYLGSTSKEFTALTVLQLAEQGRLSLDDSIRRHFRQLPAYTEAVKVRHLLEHTSGIRDYIGLWTINGAGDDTPLNETQVFRLLERQSALNFAPGSEFLYSNSGYFLLAQLTRPLAQRQFPDLARELIFAPLGLADTLYYTDRFAILPNRAQGHSPTGSQGAYRLNNATLDLAGDGGVFSSLQDVLTWLKLLDSPPPAYAASIKAMMTPARLNSGGLAEYGRGFMLRQFKGIDIIQHPGGLRGYRSDILWIPSKRLGVACLCNTSDIDAGRMTRQIASLYLNLPDPPIVKLHIAQLQRKTGQFRDTDSGDILQLQMQGDQLVANYTGFQFALQAATPTRFRSAPGSPLDFELQFKSDGDRDLPSFQRVEAESHKPARYQRIKLDPTPPASPKDYEGTFISTEVDAQCRIRFEEGQLQFEQNGLAMGALAHIAGEYFALANLNVEFLREGGKVVGMKLNTGRVRGLRFQRLP